MFGADTSVHLCGYLSCLWSLMYGAATNVHLCRCHAYLWSLMLYEISSDKNSSWMFDALWLQNVYDTIVYMTSRLQSVCSMPVFPLFPTNHSLFVCITFRIRTSALLTNLMGSCSTYCRAAVDFDPKNIAKLYLHWPCVLVCSVLWLLWLAMSSFRVQSSLMHGGTKRQSWSHKILTGVDFN